MFSEQPISDCIASSRPLIMQRNWKSNVEVAPSCPRCASSNTKFCYYNNYSLSQPRYFCKGCRRYWTRGGSLRNVPVGGGCRKNRRSKSAKLADRSTLDYVRCPPSPAESGSSAGGTDIDLEAVFAKYLSQDCNNNEVIGGDQESCSEVSSGSPEMPPCSLETRSPIEDFVTDNQLQVSDFAEGAQFYEGLPQMYENIRENLDYGHHVLEVESVLGDEIWQDIAGSDATDLSNLAWQPMVQLQDFGPVSADDSFKIPTNIIPDNWSSLDMSGYENFSRP